MTGKITTPGALYIKSLLPTPKAREKFDIYSPLNKNGVKNLVNVLIQHGGEDYHNTINDLAKLFFNKATEIGTTTPLSDYLNDSPERQAMFSEFETKVAEILKDQSLSKQEQMRRLNVLSNSVATKFSKENLNYMLDRGSTAAFMAHSGARGNPSQLQQGTGSPLMAQDVKGQPIPVVIKHSFAEGLSNAEHLAMSYGGRASTVMTQLSTEKPGALFKRLTPAVFHEVITEPDCGTKNGIPIPVKDTLSCIGRYEAGTNKLIDEDYHKAMLMGNKSTVLARSPMTCEAKEGLCQKCYGLAANGKLPEIGFNAGVVAAQSVSEVLTQAMLSTKHQGGVAGRARNPFEEASNLLNNPKENFQDEATISTQNGKVESVSKTALNDHEIAINGVNHFVSRIQDPTVSVGDSVKIGDPLSTGTINPRELVGLKGSGAGRVYISNKMRSIYSRDTSLDPKHFDVIARNMVKHVVITDPGTSGFLPGDTVEIGQLNKYYNENNEEVPLEKAEGKVLAKGSLELTPGTLLSKNHIEYLKGEGVSKVKVDKDGLKVNPIVPGLQTNKLLDKNWVSRLSFSHLGKSIQEAASLSESSPIHSTDPIAPYLVGREFGEGERGRY